jgi:hypothetical protein
MARLSSREQEIERRSTVEQFGNEYHNYGCLLNGIESIGSGVSFRTLYGMFYGMALLTAILMTFD